MQRRPGQQQPASPLPGSAPALRTVEASGEGSAFASASAAAVQPLPAGGRPVVAAREASLATWLRRVSSSHPSRADSAAAAAANDGRLGVAEAGDVPAGEQGDPPGGQESAGSAAGVPTPGTSALKPGAGTARERLPLTEVLPEEEVVDGAAFDSGSIAVGEGDAQLPPPAEPVRFHKSSDSFDFHGSSYGSPVLVPPGLALRDGGAGGVLAGLFPETTEGHLAQARGTVRWHWLG